MIPGLGEYHRPPGGLVWRPPARRVRPVSRRAVSISFVQVIAAAQDTGTFSSQTATLASATKAGACNLVFLNYDGGATLSSVTDTSLNSYTLVDSVDDTASTGYKVAVYVAKNVKAAGAAANGVKATYTGNVPVGNGAEMAVLQYAGVDANFPIDQHTIRNAQPASVNLTTASVTTKFANEIAVEWSAVGGGITATGTFTPRVTTAFADEAADKQIPASGTAIAGAMTQSPSDRWVLVLVTLRPQIPGLAFAGL